MTRVDALTQTEHSWMPDSRELPAHPASENTTTATFADRILQMLAAVKAESEMAITRATDEREEEEGGDEKERSPPPRGATGENIGDGEKHRLAIVDRPSPFLLYACMLPVFVLNRLLVLVNAYNVDKKVLFDRREMRAFLPRALHFVTDDVGFLAERLLQHFDCQGRKCFRYAGVTHPMFAHMHSSVVLPALYAATHGDAEVSDAVFANANREALALLRERYRTARIVLREDDLYYAYPAPETPPDREKKSGKNGRGSSLHPLGGVNGAAYALLHDATTNMEHASAWFRTVAWYVEKEIPPSQEVWDRYSNFNKFCFEHTDRECMRAIRETPELATVAVPDARLRADVDGDAFASVAGRFVTNIVRLYVIKLNAIGTRHTFSAQEDDYPELVVRANEPVRLLLSPDADPPKPSSGDEAGGDTRSSRNYPRPRPRCGGDAIQDSREKKRCSKKRGRKKKRTRAPYPPLGIHMTALSASLYDLVMYEYAMIRNEVRKKVALGDDGGRGRDSAAFRTAPAAGDGEDATKVTLAKEHVVRAFFPFYEKAENKTGTDGNDEERIVVCVRDVRTFVNAFAHAMTIWAGHAAPTTGSETSYTKKEEND